MRLARSSTIRYSSGRVLLTSASDSNRMKEFFCSLAMATIFWIPATAAVIAIVAAIPLNSVGTAVTGAIALLVALLLRFFIKQIAGDNLVRCEFDRTDRAD